MKDISFNNLGYLKEKLSDEDLAPIWEEVRHIQNNFNITEPANKNLAGNIEKEFDLIKCKNYAQDLILPFVFQYDKTYNFFSRMAVLTNHRPIVLNKFWVNFQKKYEFNPVHNHSGLLSFVIWLQVPYTIEDENKFSPGKNSNKPCSGQFEFYYNTITGEMTSQTVPTEKSEENTLLLFPAKLSHSVYPFYTSDDYRISISGNFSFMVD
jgi:hypothetical protein